MTPSRIPSRRQQPRKRATAKPLAITAAHTFHRAMARVLDVDFAPELVALAQRLQRQRSARGKSRKA